MQLPQIYEFSVSDISSILTSKYRRYSYFQLRSFFNYGLNIAELVCSCWLNIFWEIFSSNAHSISNHAHWLFFTDCWWKFDVQDSDMHFQVHTFYYIFLRRGCILHLYFYSRLKSYFPYNILTIYFVSNQIKLYLFVIYSLISIIYIKFICKPKFTVWLVKNW